MREQLRVLSRLGPLREVVAQIPLLAGPFAARSELRDDVVGDFVESFAVTQGVLEKVGRDGSSP